METLQTQLAAVDRGGGGGGQDKKQLKMMHEVIRNLEVHTYTLCIAEGFLGIKISQFTGNL